MTATDEIVREALIIAASHEAASFYGLAAGDDSIASRARQRAADEAAVDAANERIRIEKVRRALLADVRDGGWPTSHLMKIHGVTYETVAAARRHARGAA